MLNGTHTRWNAAILSACLAMLWGQSAVSGDSTTLRPSLAVPKSSAAGIVGEATDGKSCRFHGEDSKIHCLYDPTGLSEYLADSILTPSFAKYGNLHIGSVPVADGVKYAFLNAEQSAPASGGPGAEYCRLALQFITDAGEIIWIWHYEIRFEDKRHLAVIDTDGDLHPDLAVSGMWNGNVSGTNRWWTPDPYSGDYSAEERSYPARPGFSSLSPSGRSRACKPDAAKAAALVDVATSTGATVGDSVVVWRSIYRP